MRGTGGSNRRQEERLKRVTPLRYLALMTSSATSPIHAEPPAIAISESEVHITNLLFEDDTVAAYLSTLPPEQQIDQLVRAIGIGVHGLAASTMRATVDEMQQQVRHIIANAADAARENLDEAMATGRSELAARLDPEVRSSVTARAVAELAGVHKSALDRLDPERTDSHTGRLVEAITELLGPGGQLAQRLEEAFDSAEAEHGLGRLLDTFERRFQEMRDLLVGEQHRQEEADRGTAKGFEFEDAVEDVLRTEARSLSGCVVERTSHSGGTLGVQSKVGDFVVTLPDGVRVAIEAKNTARVGLSGSTGILAELDQAMDNRSASWAICVSSGDAFPAEVGSFGVYGNRLLVVDAGDGTLTRVALRWVAAASRATAADVDKVDTAAALERLDRLRGLAQHFSRSKKVLAGAQSGLDTVREELDSLRTELLDLVDDATRSLQPRVVVPRQVA